MTELKCEVCGKKAVGVAASVTGPISLAYCKECLKEGIEPYNMLVSMVSCAGAESLEQVNEPYRKMILKNLDYYNKTVEEFMLDVKKINEEMNSYFCCQD